MNLDHNNPLNSLEPLPADFDAEARHMDELLAAHARRNAVPIGMSDRVYQMSVQSLPKSRQPSLRLVGTGAEVHRRHVLFTLHRTAWGRAAMAASVAIVCTVAWLTMQSAPSPPPHSGMLAINDGANGASTSTFDNHGEMLPAGSLDHLDNDMAYLLNTGSLTSMSEVQQELTMLVAALEM